SIHHNMWFFVTNASICDSNGQMLFYTNGEWIANRANDTMFNSVNFNPGWATDSFYNYGLGFSQGAVIIPDPGNHLRYYVFNITGEAFFSYHLPSGNIYLDGQPFHLSYSI